MIKDGMNDPGRRERITLQQPIEESPDETTLAIAATEPLTPASGNRAAEVSQRQLRQLASERTLSLASFRYNSLTVRRRFALPDSIRSNALRTLPWLR